MGEDRSVLWIQDGLRRQDKMQISSPNLFVIKHNKNVNVENRHVDKRGPRKVSVGELEMSCLVASHLFLCLIDPGSSAGKESACSAGDPSLIPGLDRFLGEEID